MRNPLFVFKKSEPQRDKPGLLFLHIPKTAGTSFRMSADRYAWGLKVYQDYGDRSISSRLIRKCYKTRDFSPIEAISKRRTMLAGHFFLRRYARYYPVHDVVTFVREPVQRMLSHYHYMVRTNRYEGSLESFINDRRFQNLQSRTFCRLPFEAIGFIGITEDYQESLELINRVYSLNIPVRKFNRNEDKEADSYTEDEDLIELIKSLNRTDIQLYEKSKLLFRTRQKVLEDGMDYVYGKLESSKDNEVTGWAFNPTSPGPVKLDVLVNNEKVTQLEAQDYRPGFKRYKVHRDGNVGFRYTHERRFNEEDKIEVRVAATNQLIL